MKIQVNVNVSVNGVSSPLADLVGCCCGHTVGTADDLSECLECGGFMCERSTCDCPCPVYED